MVFFWRSSTKQLGTVAYFDSIVLYSPLSYLESPNFSFHRYCDRPHAPFCSTDLFIFNSIHFPPSFLRILFVQKIPLQIRPICQLIALYTFCQYAASQRSSPACSRLTSWSHSTPSLSYLQAVHQAASSRLAKNSTSKEVGKHVSNKEHRSVGVDRLRGKSSHEPSPVLHRASSCRTGSQCAGAAT